MKRQLKTDTVFETVDASFFIVEFMGEIAGLNKERQLIAAAVKITGQHKIDFNYRRSIMPP